MKHSDLRGTGTVFRFSVAQHYRATSVRVFLLILFVLALASIPLAKLFVGEKEAETSSITKLYLRNDTGFALNLSDITADERYASLTIEETESSDETFAKLLAESPTNAAIALSFEEGKASFLVHAFYGENSQLGQLDVSTLSGVVSDALHNAILHTANVTDEQVATIQATCTSQVLNVADYQNDSPQSNTALHQVVNMFFSYLVMILGVLAMSYILQLAVEEKASKLVEQLLVSVNPTAILVGKILAVTVFLFAGLGLIAFGIFCSYSYVKATSGVAFLVDPIRKLGLTDILPNLTVGGILMVLFSVILAYCMLTLLSGVVGSCCSKTEDIQSASLYITLIALLGYLTASIAPLFESTAVNLFTSLFPLISIFIAPANYVCGKIGLGVLLLSWFIQLLTICFFAWLAGKTYKMMIFYRGSFPSPSKFIKLLRGDSKKEKEVHHET